MVGFSLLVEADILTVVTVALAKEPEVNIALAGVQVGTVDAAVSGDEGETLRRDSFATFDAVHGYIISKAVIRLSLYPLIGMTRQGTTRLRKAISTRTVRTRKGLSRSLCINLIHCDECKRL